MKKLFIKTFGCQMNDYDASRMVDLLRSSHGYHRVEDPEQADLVVFNTCHIREKAEEKLFSELGRLHKMVRTARIAQGRSAEPAAIFAVGGCVAQATGQEIFRRAPFVQLVFGPQTYHRLPTLLTRLEQGGGPICDVAIAPESKFDLLPLQEKTGAAASVTVQEGCNKFCAFCVVPFTRGQEWSRPVDAILAEVAGLVQQGAVEIQLLGQNVNAYQGMDKSGLPHDLPLLIRRVALLPGVERIRFVTSHPADMTDDLVELFADLPQLCPYLHLPIQSGSNRILARMGRGHTVEAYLEWIRRLRQASPEIAIASDFIVGFPGETEADFQETLQLVEQVSFDHAYSFCFSSRPGTQAEQMGEHLPAEVSSARLAILQERLNAHQWLNNQKRVGRTEAVLVEGSAKKGSGELSGRTPEFRRVNFPGEQHWIGHIVPVQITEGLPNSLRGQIARTAAVVP
ncbi:MAG: tRNA (N6-isopentenyl adenosine(37)-C2)-methylthiotransferase MiaB [Magnetococcales bacterium]|nr:tRNA (N6-isopentenyl adenosine(37)-C2)-methylthiotransferase MiaB [Magnetococcales bacterium]